MTLKPAPTTEQLLRNLSRDVYSDEPAECSVEQHIQYLARACRIADANLKAYAREAAAGADGVPPAWDDRSGPSFSWVDPADYLRRALETADHIAMRAAAIRALLPASETDGEG